MNNNIEIMMNIGNKIHEISVLMDKLEKLPDPSLHRYAENDAGRDLGDSVSRLIWKLRLKGIEVSS